MSNAPISLEDLITVTEGDYPYHLLDDTPIETQVENEEPIEIDALNNTIDTPEEVENEIEEETEELENETEESEEEPEVDENAEPESSNQLEKVFNLLKDVGALALPEDYKFDSASPEALKEALAENQKNMYKTMFDSIWDRLPETDRSYLTYKLKGGTEDMQTYISQFQPINYDDLDLSDVNTQREVVAKQLSLTTKMKEASIAKLIDSLEATDALASQAEDSLEELKKYSDFERNAQIKELEDIKAAKNKLYSEAVQLTDIPEERKTKVQAFMNNEVTRADGVKTDFDRKIAAASNNPQHMAQLADLFFDSYDPVKGFDLTRYAKKRTTAKVDSFQKNLDNLFESSKTRLKSSRMPTDKSNTNDWGKFLDLLPD